MSYKALKLDLSEKQVLDALKGKRIRVLPSQINTGTTFISLHPVNIKKIENAYIRKKGFLLTLSRGELAETAQRMDGSGFWKDVWNGLKKTWGVLKKTGVLSAVADIAIPAAAAFTGQPALGAPTRALIKETTGVGIGDVMSNVDKKAHVARKRMLKKDKYEMLRGSGIYLS